MQVVKLSLNDTDKLKKFCHQCQEIGYKNNQNLLSLKWGDQYDLPSQAQYWALMIENDIVSLSGCHSFDIEHKILRVLFRSATIPPYDKLFPGISKNHMNSVPFSMLLPEQIKYGIENSYQKFWLTTVDDDNDVSGKMNRTHQVMKLLVKRGIVDFIKKENYFYIDQYIWQINVSKYFEVQSAFIENQSYARI